jgi:hypothetical protein
MSQFTATGSTLGMQGTNSGSGMVAGVVSNEVKIACYISEDRNFVLALKSDAAGEWKEGIVRQFKGGRYNTIDKCVVTTGSDGKLKIERSGKKFYVDLDDSIWITNYEEGMPEEKFDKVYLQ